MATHKKRQTKPRPFLRGVINVPVGKSGFGEYIDLSDQIPADADCIIVLVNSGGGLNAGHPKPVGFVMLPHQLYLEDLEELIETQTRENRSPIWITAIPIRSSEYIDIWTQKD